VEVPLPFVTNDVDHAWDPAGEVAVSEVSEVAV
jgi:hypothetical protein